ncbi:MAG: hypothetical protein L0Z49_04710 [Actinobacteria bacterium]|nr:hypothetical protein [Actinomycetota bacterium]
MDGERQEVYERIPWETLQQPRRDYAWVVMAVAGAVAVGALAYSFVRSQPAAPVTAETVPTATLPSPAASTPATIPTPVVVAEADLYAVDQDAIRDQVRAHAEWFAVELVSYDGSDTSKEVLSALLPAGVPVPEAPEGTQVFVDYASAGVISELAPMRYRVEVLVRSLAAGPEGGFLRQSPLVVGVDVVVDDTGIIRVAAPATLRQATPPTPHLFDSQPLPETVALDPAWVSVLGGSQTGDGWSVYVMMAGADGVTRPLTVTVD